MNSTLKNVLIVFLALWVVKGCMFSSSHRGRSGSNTTVNVNVDSQAKDGLDLEALIELVKQGRSAEDIERKLNQAGSINNLDLNEDGKVDFVKVTEYGNKSTAYGFAFTVEVAEGEEQEIAEIEIEKNGNSADIVARGNEEVYGYNHYYHSNSLLTNLLIWNYLFHPHPYYYSSFHWGYYPSYYRPYAPVSTSVYRSTTRNVKRNSNATRVSSSSPKSKSSLSNPKRGKTADKGIKKSLAKPTQSQKSFKARSSSKSVKSGGFGKSTRSSSSRSSSTSKTRSRSSYNSRSSSRSRGFGGSGK
jgi:hypothetical protein